MRIEYWNIRIDSRNNKRLTGIVYGHPSIYDGARITTAPIIGKFKNKVKTQSGSLYELGRSNTNLNKNILNELKEV